MSTTIDAAGRPVITARTATDRRAATNLVTEGQRAPGAVAVELDARVAAAVAPVGDDPMRNSQWDLPSLRVADAWQRSTGAGVTVAIVDSGVDAAHPDLAGQVLPGLDLITGTEGIAIDPFGHGTHVAGTIAAVAGNGEGISGVAPEARILPVRVLAADGTGYMSDAANGVVYATEHGADVINLSISAATQVEAMTNAVAYARSRGVVVVAAAGNERGKGSPVSFPGADPGVIAVGATDAYGNAAWFSTQGGYVDVAAPGVDILSTYPTATGLPYRRMNGTSMAAPHVAAIAALLKSADRSLTPDQIEQALESSATDLGLPGRDDDFGYGRIDATAALATVPLPAIAEPPVQATSEPTDTPTSEPTDTPTSEPTDTPTSEPTETATSAPTADPTSEPTRDPAADPAPAAEPSPAESAPAATPAPAPVQAVARLVRTRPGQLTIVITDGGDAVAELQRESDAGWETVQTFPAVLLTRINDLQPGRPYRVVVSGVTSQTVRM